MKEIAMQDSIQKLQLYRAGLVVAIDIIRDWEERAKHSDVIDQVRFRAITLYTCLTAMMQWMGGENTDAYGSLQQAIVVADQWHSSPPQNETGLIDIDEDIEGLPRNDVHGIYDALVYLTDDLAHMEQQYVAHRTQDMEAEADQEFDNETQQGLFWIRGLRALAEATISCVHAERHVFPFRLRVAQYELAALQQLQQW